MPVDTTVPNSPGWWMKTLWNQLREEQPRLNRLDAYRRGEPPVVMGVDSDRLKSAFLRFQNMSRSNFADLIVSAMTNRMTVRSIRTAAANDDNGDEEAWAMLAANGFPVTQTDLFRHMGTFGGGYMVAGSPTPDSGGYPIITVEDPRFITTMQDPLRPWITRAAFKIYHDVVDQMDYAILWLPGQKWVARRPRKPRSTDNINVSWSPSAFDLMPVSDLDGNWIIDQPDGVLDPAGFLDDFDGPTSEQYDLQKLPVVQIGNRNGVGEFELHTDLLDRIAHVTLQQMVIATLQAFKQRAIEVDREGEQLPDEDEDGNKIDYNDIFEADPGAIWRLPLGAKIWESGEVNMQNILGASKSYVLELAATTQTPFPMFSPDSANQSANGASLYREGLTFKVEDRCRIAGAGLAQIVAIGFELMGKTDRADASKVIVDWAPADRYSILEMAQADAQSTLPRAQKLAKIYGYSPADVKVAMAQYAQDALAAAAAAPPPTAPRVGSPAT